MLYILILYICRNRLQHVTVTTDKSESGTGDSPLDAGKGIGGLDWGRNDKQWADNGDIND